LKNFWMLATRSGYRLAPAFDLVPDIVGRGEHTLSFQYHFGCPNAEQLLAIASEWKVSNAEKTLHEVAAAVDQFADTAHQMEASDETLEKILADIHRRRQLICPEFHSPPSRRPSSR
jgi:serine/threonine protein kinase HipA of HipAB toxin-antitoxin module